MIQGAIYSVIPRRRLEELDIKPIERRRFRAFGDTLRGI